MGDTKAVAVKENLALSKVEDMGHIVGFEDIGNEVVPMTFYKVVYSNSTGTGDVPAGNFFISDTGKGVERVNFCILRAKKVTREMERDGKVEYKDSIGILGVDLDRGMEPFIFSISPSSFKFFGRLMKQIQNTGAKLAWEYPVKMYTEKTESQRVDNGKIVKNSYYLVQFLLSEKKLDDKDIKALEAVYTQYASKLDRSNDLMEEEQEINPAGAAEAREDLRKKVDSFRSEKVEEGVVGKEDINPDEIPF